MAETKNSNTDEKLDKTSDEELAKQKEIEQLEITNRSGIRSQTIEQEMQRGYREVEIDNYGKVRIYMPTPGVESEITDFKARLIGVLLKQSEYITQDQVMNELRKRGVWNDKIEKDLGLLETDIAEFTKEIMLLQHADKIDADQLFSLRDRRKSLMDKRRSICAGRDMLLQGTIESKIEEEVLKHQLMLCAKTVDDEQIWATMDDLSSEHNKKLVNTLVSKAAYFWQGWSEDLLQMALDNLTM